MKFFFSGKLNSFIGLDSVLCAIRGCQEMLTALSFNVPWKGVWIRAATGPQEEAEAVPLSAACGSWVVMLPGQTAKVGPVGGGSEEEDGAAPTLRGFSSPAFSTLVLA